jgi:hypothetical protein
MGYTVRAVLVHGIEFSGILAAAVIALLGTRGAPRARMLALGAVAVFLLGAFVDVAISVVSLWGAGHLGMSYDGVSTFIDWAIFPLVLLNAVGMALLALAVVADRTPAAPVAGRPQYGQPQYGQPQSRPATYSQPHPGQSSYDQPEQSLFEDRPPQQPPPPPGWSRPGSGGPAH